MWYPAGATGRAIVVFCAFFPRGPVCGVKRTNYVIRPEPEPEPGPVSRLFIAVWPPPAVHGRLQALDRPGVPGVRWTTEDQWHVTLRFLGDIGDLAAETGQGVMDALRSALADASAGQAPLVASVAARARALGDRVWVLPVTGLDNLATAVATATSQVVAPAGPDRRRFRGHLTLARARRPGGLSGLGALAWPDLSDTWPVREITLVSSLLHRGGARYRIEGRLELQAAAPEPRSGR